MTEYEEVILNLKTYLYSTKDTEEIKLANLRKIIELMIDWLDQTSE